MEKPIHSVEVLILVLCLCGSGINTFCCFSWEKTGSVTQLNSHMISRAIESNLVNLTSLFGSESLHVHVIADILVTVEIPTPNSCYNPSIQVVLNLTQSTVNYFFVCTKDEGTSDKVRGFSKVCRILKRLCVYSKVAKVLALRELLERALFKSENVLFGAKNNSHHHEEEKCLLKQNKKIVSDLTRYVMLYIRDIKFPEQNDSFDETFIRFQWWNYR